MSQRYGTEHCTLENAEVRHAAHPQTFHLHPRWVRESLSPGDFAKVVFVGETRPGTPPDCKGERMWVRVSAREGDAGVSLAYRGTLQNHPYYLINLSHGDEVRFGPEHVVDVELHAN